MPSKFDRVDAESRALLASYRTLSDRIAEETANLRQFLHVKYYPGFGRVEGLKRRAILTQLRGWRDIFHGSAPLVFQCSSQVEAKLVYSIATEARCEHERILGRTRHHRGRTDLLLRALHGQLEQRIAPTALDTEALYDWLTLAEQIALYLAFVALVLFSSRPDEDQTARREAGFLDLDWQLIARFAEPKAPEISAEIIQMPGLYQMSEADQNTPSSAKPQRNRPAPRRRSR